MKDTKIATLFKKKGDHIYPEAKCGFRSDRSFIDTVIPVIQLQEKYRNQCQPLHIAFVDLTQPFDLVSCSRLFKLLHNMAVCQIYLE